MSWAKLGNTISAPSINTTKQKLNDFTLNHAKDFRRSAEKRCAGCKAAGALRKLILFGVVFLML